MVPHKGERSAGRAKVESDADGIFFAVALVSKEIFD
jgi:hypothetical protein